MDKASTFQALRPSRAHSLNEQGAGGPISQGRLRLRAVDSVTPSPLLMAWRFLPVLCWPSGWGVESGDGEWREGASRARAARRQEQPHPASPTVAESSAPSLFASGP